MPLHQAAYDGDVSEIRRLVEAGAGLGDRNVLGMTPLMVAVVHGHIDVVIYLVRAMSATELALTDNKSNNVLRLMIQNKRSWKHVIRDICNKCPSLLDQGGPSSGNTAKWEGYRDAATILERCKDEKKHRIFAKGISDTTEEICDITITFIGHEGSGKTTLHLELMEEEIPEEGPGSTDTADFFTNHLGFNPSTGFRQKLGKGGELERGRRTLRKIIHRHSCPQNIPSPVSTDESGLDTTTAGASVESPVTKRRLKPTKGQRESVDEVMNTPPDDDENDDVKGFVTIYDFGGEKVFYNTCHSFMSSNMVFVLVFDVAMCLDPNREKEGYERIESWLKSVATYAKARESGSPPIILVGSHVDIVQGTDEEKERLFATILENLKKKTVIKDIMDKHVHGTSFSIAHMNDSTKNKEIYDRIWKAIMDVAPLQSGWMKPVSAKWVALQHELVRLKNKGKVIIALPELLKLNRGLVAPLAESEIDDFLCHLQVSGSILCFNLSTKNPFLVLKAQWILSAFKAVITAPKFTAVLSPEQKDKWSEYKKTAKLPIAFLKQLWQREKHHGFLEKEDLLYIIMESLGLISKPLSDDTEEVDFYIVPCMLNEKEPDVILSVLSGQHIVRTVTLCLRFDNEYIPQAIWDKTIAACIHRFQPLNEEGYDGSTFIQRGFVCLAVDYLWNMIINCQDNAMKITMFKKAEQAIIPPGSGVNLLTIIEYLLKKILIMNHQSHLDYCFYFHNNYQFTEEEDLMTPDTLLQGPSVPNHSLQGSDWISQENYYVWFQEPEQGEPPPARTGVKLTAKFKKKNLPEDERPSLQEIGRVSKLIHAKAHQMFFVELGCPLQKVENIKEEYRQLSFRSFITKVLIHLHSTRFDLRLSLIEDAMRKYGMLADSLVTTLNANRVETFGDVPLSKAVLGKRLSRDDIPMVERHVQAKAYFNLFLELGLEAECIDRCDMDYRKIEERITALLEKWIKISKSNATVNKVLLAMKECEMNFAALACDFNAHKIKK